MSAIGPSATSRDETTPATAAVDTSVPQITHEETHRLAECCAFFQAEHFREAQPDTLRESDVDIAQEKLEEIARSLGPDEA